MKEETTVEELDGEVANAKATFLREVARIEPSQALTKHVMEAVEDEALRESVRAHVVELEPSPDLTSRIMEAVADEAAGERRRARWLRAAAAIAGIAATVAVVLQVRTSAPEMRTSEQVAQHKADPAVEAADWLVAQQCPDGTWSPAQTGGNEAFRPALTALAMMALQRHAPERHAEAIARAKAALEALQTEDGAFGREPSAKLYNHSFATYALLSLANENGEELTPALQRAITFSLGSQNHLGSWDYPPRETGNSALTVWQLGILMQARKAGWSDDAGQLRRGLSWLRRKGHDGLLDYREDFDRRYTPKAGSVTLTAMATSTILEAAEDFPELRDTAENAVASLHIACERLSARAAGNDYRGDLYATVVALLSAQRG
jgi:hypothetical protein